MFPILQVGPLAIQVSGLILLIGLWLGLTLSERQAPRHGLSPDAIYNLALVALLAGLAGARLTYAARYLQVYLADPLGLLAPSPATLAPLEGVLVGGMAAWVVGARARLPLRPTLDVLAPALTVLAAAVALAHLASGDGFGAVARLPWSIFLWDAYRHPTQVYELLAALGVLAVWRWGRGRGGFAGFDFLLALAGLAAGRVLLEAFRGDSWLLAGGLRGTQVAGLLVLAAALALMRRWSIEAPKH